MEEITAFLKALTPESEAGLGTSLFKIPRFPFRVGRESRIGQNQFFADSRRQPNSVPNNDLYLIDTAPLMNISREHFQIELRDGNFFLVDRRSVCGTLVEGVIVGRDRAGGEKPLKSGDVIIVGSSESRHVFKFVCNER